MAEEVSIANLPTQTTNNPLTRLEEASVQNAHHYRKLSKLHEKLNERGRMLSLSGALKLYKAYEGALEGVLTHKRLVDEALVLLDDALKVQGPSAEANKMEVDDDETIMREEVKRDLSDSHQTAEVGMMTTMERASREETLTRESQMAGALVDSPFEEGNSPLSPSLPLSPSSSPPSPSPSSSVSSSSSPRSQSRPQSHSQSRSRSNSRSPLSSAPSSLPSDAPEGPTGENVESGPESTQEGDLDIIGSPGGGGGNIPVGSTVAVRCRVDEESPAEEWILATIVRGAFTTGEEGRWSYEVEDVEFEDTASSPLRSSSVKGSPHKSGGKRPLRLVVSSDQIRKLPATEEEALNNTVGIKVRQRVLALFPGTTCLYAATVISTPVRRKKTRDFLLKFSDDDVPSRAVPPRYVLRSEE